VKLLIRRIEIRADEIRIVYKIPLQVPFEPCLASRGFLQPSRGFLQPSRGFLQHCLACAIIAPDAPRFVGRFIEGFAHDPLLVGAISSTIPSVNRRKSSRLEWTPVELFLNGVTEFDVTIIRLLMAA